MNIPPPFSLKYGMMAWLVWNIDLTLMRKDLSHCSSANSVGSVHLRLYTHLRKDVRIIHDDIKFSIIFQHGIGRFYPIFSHANFTLRKITALPSGLRSDFHTVVDNHKSRILTNFSTFPGPNPLTTPVTMDIFQSSLHSILFCLAAMESCIYII